MPVLVAGLAGYIGSHTARDLWRHGQTVLIYDNLSTGNRVLARGFLLSDALRSCGGGRVLAESTKVLR